MQTSSISDFEIALVSQVVGGEHLYELLGGPKPSLEAYEVIRVFDGRQAFCFKLPNAYQGGYINEILIFYRLQLTGSDRIIPRLKQKYFKAVREDFVRRFSQVLSILQAVPENKIFFSVEQSGELIRMANKIAREACFDVLIFGVTNSIFPESDPFDGEIPQK